MVWLLVILFIAALVGGFMWMRHIWQSRFGNRMMDYDAREIAFIAQARADVSPEATPKPIQAKDALPPSMPIVAPAAAPTPQTNSERPVALLDEADVPIYLQLKNSIGDYPLLIGVDVARLLADKQNIPPRVHADFVVCRKDFTPVVVIFLDRSMGDPLRERAIQLLKQTRVRLLRWEYNNPPDRDSMRQQIFKTKSAQT